MTLLLRYDMLSYPWPMWDRARGLSICRVRLTRRLTPRQWAFDAVLAVAVFALGIFGTVEIDGASEATFSRPSDFYHFALVGLMALPLVFRRVYSIPVFVVVLAAWIADRGLDYPDSPAAFGVGVAFYTLGAELDRRRSLRIGGISGAVVVGWTIFGTWLLESVTAVDVFTTLIATLTPLLLGREMHERRRRVEELQARAERAETEREERTKQAVLEERARIARELHDVVAHQMTVMTLQAEGAKRLAAGSDPRLAEALETIRVAGHSALAEMRRTVGLLRTDEDTPETEPLPRLSDLAALVAQMRDAGVPVEFDVRGNQPPLSDSTELSIYRIVQESLTNAVRHGGPEVTTKVSVEYGEEGVDVTVSDDGRGAAADSQDNGGHGLIGMRERIAVLGGDFEAGPRAGGGYLVHASIPVDP